MGPTFVIVSLQTEDPHLLLSQPPMRAWFVRRIGMAHDRCQNIHVGTATGRRQVYVRSGPKSMRG